MTTLPAVAARLVLIAPPAARPKKEGNYAMFSMLALGRVALVGAFLLAEFDPTKWAQLLILSILGTSAVVTVLIREFRKIRELIKSVPKQVETHVAKAIDECPIPTTPEQVKASDERQAKRIATAVVELQTPILKDVDQELHKIKHNLAGTQAAASLKKEGEERGIDWSKP